MKINKVLLMLLKFRALLEIIFKGTPINISDLTAH